MIENDERNQNGPLIVVPTSDSTIVDAMDELKALTDVMQALRAVNGDAARSRILAAAAGFYRLAPVHQFSASPGSAPAVQGQPFQQSSARSFSEERPISPKDFLVQKQPKTDVERVACLAYFLTHYREIPAFKTIDISKLNTESAQPKFSNAAVAVDNATRSHYLVPASKGNKQISAMGELFVQALPDREAAKEAIAMKLKPRRKKRGAKVEGAVSQEENQ